MNNFIAQASIPTCLPTLCLTGPIIPGQSIDFENFSGALALSGSLKILEPAGHPKYEAPVNPWTYDAAASCRGTYGLTAGGADGDYPGVKEESVLHITVPAGASSMTYYYSHPLI